MLSVFAHCIVYEGLLYIYIYIYFRAREQETKALCLYMRSLFSFLYRLTSSGGSTSLQELTLLAAARRSAAAAAAAAAAGPMSGMSSSGGGGPADLHPAYRLNPYVEHLYSSLHSSPTASLRGLSPLDPRGMCPTTSRFI